jgi:nitrogen regulatory protein PII
MTGMKLVSSVVRPERLDAVTQGLREANVQAIRVAEVRDLSPEGLRQIAWMGHEHHVPSVMMEVQVVVFDEDVDQVVRLILKCARTRSPGDGHVCVMPVDYRFDIHTGSRDVS